MNEQLLSNQPQDYRVMYVDMNSFFASVEQQENPELRHKPVGVAACLGRNCTIIAASIEAKRLGIGTGTRVSHAREICPDVILVRDGPTKYRDYHRRIMTVLQKTYCQVSVKSIDEAALLVPSYARNLKACIQLSTDIKAAIQAELGEHVKCSIGIAPTVWLAKMAASFQKPDGLYCVRLNGLKHFYGLHKLTDCTGIGRRFARQLYARGVNSVADFASRPLPFMRRTFGVVGEQWYLRLRGIEIDQFAEVSHKKSLSHQVTVMSERTLSTLQCQEYMAKLSYKLAARLRGDGLYAAGLGLYVAFGDGSSQYKYLTAQRSLKAHRQVYQFALTLLEWIQPAGKEIRLFSLVLIGLSTTEQLHMALDDNPGKYEAVAAVIDSLNQRFGSGTIGIARGWGSDIMPDRVGFGRP